MSHDSVNGEEPQSWWQRMLGMVLMVCFAVVIMGVLWLGIGGLAGSFQRQRESMTVVCNLSTYPDKTSVRTSQAECLRLKRRVEVVTQLGALDVSVKKDPQDRWSRIPTFTLIAEGIPVSCRNGGSSYITEEGQDP